VSLGTRPENNVPAATAHSSSTPSNGSLGLSTQSTDFAQPGGVGNNNRSSLLFSASSASLARGSVSAQPRARAISKTRESRRLSRGTYANPSPAADRSSTRENNEKKKAPNGIIGVCALDAKARSKPSRNILNRLIANGEFDVIIFGDKVILDEEVENWPVCDYLISFFSDGFPLDKAIAYKRLRKPFCVNDLPMQTVLWDRRLCLIILDKFSIPTPKRIEVSRDGGPRLSSPDLAVHFQERAGIQLPGPEDGTGGGTPAPNSVHMSDDGDTLVVDGKRLTKPFVEKPVNGEDHNIHIYFPKSAGGGGRRLFRKVNNKSSERDPSLDVPRCITEPEHSYIYEQFIEAAKAEDVKAYTVGTTFCHAETRKSPVVDGIVKRNPNGKEIRYVTELTKEERTVAAKVVQAFGQTVCGFDLLRSEGKSYVIDVNGWSFVKDNNEYYEQCARILRELFIREKQRLDSTPQPSLPEASTTETSATEATSKLTSHRSIKDFLKSHPHVHHHKHHQKEKDSSLAALSSPPTTEKAAVASQSLAVSQAVQSAPSVLDPSTLSENVIQPMPPSQKSPIPPPASKAQWTLKGIVSVIRHADRTPKQKFKFTFHTKPFVDLLRGHQEEVLLVGEAALNSVLEAVQLAMVEGKEDPAKLQLLKTSLIKKGAWTGTKVQIKPMFRSRKTAPPVNEDATGLDTAPKLDHHDSTQTVTLSRISAAENNLELDKLQLIIKWGGEPTHSARYQAQDLGENLRNDLSLLNKECLDNVCIFSSSERRVTTSAQIFASAFLEDKNLPSDYIQVRKDLLDDSNAAKDDMDKVKKKLKQLLREGDAAPPEFTWPKDFPEPFLIVRRVVELMKFHHQVMLENYKKLQTPAMGSLAAALKAHAADQAGSRSSSPTGSMTSAQRVSSIQPRWCSGEDADLFLERWDKLFKEFIDADKVDPSKLSELYDTLKFDALHNRQFLEWVFMPDLGSLDSEAITDPPTPDAGPTRANTGAESISSRRGSKTENDKPPSKDWKALAQKIGIRRPEDKTATGITLSATSSKSGESPESYFNLHKGPSSDSKAKHDARLSNLRELYKLAKTLFDYIGPQEYGISPDEKLSIGLLTSLPLLKEIVADLEEMQASDGGSSFFYFTKESHIYTLLNCIIEGDIKTKIERKNIPELDYLSQINFELYESQNAIAEEAEGKDRFNYSIRISISPGCHTSDPLDL
jgi:inositol hexakisphosphate/diphosphoinositol-pentakisphosphate kinase